MNLDKDNSFNNKIKRLLKLFNQILASFLNIFSNLNEVLIFVINFFRDIKIKD